MKCDGSCRPFDEGAVHPLVNTEDVWIRDWLSIDDRTVSEGRLKSLCNDPILYQPMSVFFAEELRHKWSLTFAVNKLFVAALDVLERIGIFSVDVGDVGLCICSCASWLISNLLFCTQTPTHLQAHHRASRGRSPMRQ